VGRESTLGVCAPNVRPESLNAVQSLAVSQRLKSCVLSYYKHISLKNLRAALSVIYENRKNKLLNRLGSTTATKTDEIIIYALPQRKAPGIESITIKIPKEGPSLTLSLLCCLAYYAMSLDCLPKR
jgi:hypothetical protein